MQPTIFITRKAAWRAAQGAANRGRAHYAKVKSWSRTAGDRSRESGFVAVLFDVERRFIGYATEGT